MNLETDNFIEYYSENRHEYNDPEITSENGIITLTNKGFEQQNPIGSFLVIIFLPLFVIIVISTKQLPTSTTNFLIVFATIYFFLTLYKRAQKLIANNSVVLDTEKRTVTIVPEDYFRKKLLKSKVLTLPFNSILSIKTRTRRYDKFHSGLRILLGHGNKETVLLDIWNKKLGNQLRDFVQKTIRAGN